MTLPPAAEATFTVKTFGCKLNQAEEDEIIAQLQAQGWRYVAQTDRPGLCIINSCTVTHRARQKSLAWARRVKRASPSTLVILAGCLVDTETGLENTTYVDLCLGNAAKQTLTRYLPPAGPSLPGQGSQAPRRARANLVVQTGCDRFCSYCIIPYARGPSRSRKLPDILTAAGRLIAQGFQEIVLTGIHLAGFRLPRPADPKRPIADLECLIQSLLDIDSTLQLRLSSLEPMDLDMRFVRFLADRPRVARQLHVPIQHGSDRILARMGRPYTIEDVRPLLDGLGAIPGLLLGTDVIVGFPGETAADFQRMEAMLRCSPINHLHVFPFSARPHTAAGRITQRVNKQIIRARVKKLRELGARKKRQFLKRQVGSVQPAIIIDHAGAGNYRVLTGNYISGNLASGNSYRSGCKVMVKLVSLHEGRGVFTPLA